jgi:hypothetical protein
LLTLFSKEKFYLFPKKIFPNFKPNFTLINYTNKILNLSGKKYLPLSQNIYKLHFHNILMKRGKRITINLSNKVAYTLMAIIILAVTSGFVFAYNSGNPELMGHTLNEIEGEIGSYEFYDCHDVGIYNCRKGDHPPVNCPEGEFMVGMETVYTTSGCYGVAMTKMKCCKAGFK